MGFVNQLVTGYWTKIQSNGLALASRVPLVFFLCPWCNSHSNAKVQQTMPPLGVWVWGHVHERSNDYLFARKDCLVGQNDSFVLKEQNRNKTPSDDWRMIGRLIWLFCIMTNLSASFLTSKMFSHMMSYDSSVQQKIWNSLENQCPILVHQMACIFHVGDPIDTATLAPGLSHILWRFTCVGGLFVLVAGYPMVIYRHFHYKHP